MDRPATATHRRGSRAVLLALAVLGGLGLLRFAAGQAGETRGTSVTDAIRREPSALRFNGRVFGFDPEAGAALTETQERLGEGSSAVVLLGLRAMPGGAVRAALAGRGVDLLDYVPEGGWIARVHGSKVPWQNTDVTCFQPLDAALRLSPGLRAGSQPGAEVPVLVHAVRDRPVAGVNAALAAAGFSPLAVVGAGDRAYLAGRIGPDQLARFLGVAANHGDVQWIEAAGRARLLNDTARRITQSGSWLGPVPFHARGIHGADQVIAICDTGLDVDGCYFRDARHLRPPINGPEGVATDWTLRKVIAADFYDPTDAPDSPLAWDNHGHGTAVAGCAAGSSLDDPWGTQSDNGMAPGARLIIQDAGFAGEDACADLPGLGCPVTNFYPVLRQAVSQGARIHNNSWGDQEQSLQQNRYTQTCRELDLVTWVNREFLVVCSAGNSGFDDTVGSPSTAKTGLSVAATMTGSNQERVAVFSSRGWASDGRCKPDLAAPGQNIRTAASDGDLATYNCYRASGSGTSFAAPIVAGLAALVRDYFAQGYYPTGQPGAGDRRPDPSAALVKAVLINAAVPMANASAPPPARDQGWGRVNLSRTLPLAPNGPALFVVDETRGFADTPAFPYRTYLRVTATNQPLRITLVWSDYPATPGADRHLVNDLDLRVRTPGLELKGNHFVDGQSAPGGPHDRLNNVEQVQWTPDRTGLVQIDVWAHRVVVGPQGFALVATGDFTAVSIATDADADGHPDVWEEWYFGSLDPSPDADPDSDGVSNREECAAGTDPRNPRSRAQLAFVGLDSDGAALEMTVCEAMRYTLERASGASPFGSWTSVSPAVLVGEPGGETTLRFMDPAVPDAEQPVARYYRVRIESASLHATP
jgi:subtilisin family serine protease